MLTMATGDGNYRVALNDSHEKEDRWNARTHRLAVVRSLACFPDVGRCGPGGLRLRAIDGTRAADSFNCQGPADGSRRR